jgi:hypothetical protein
MGCFHSLKLDDLRIPIGPVYLLPSVVGSECGIYEVGPTNFKLEKYPLRSAFHDSNPSRFPIYAVSHIFPFMWHTDRASDTRLYSEIMAFSSQAILFDLVALSWNERASEIRMG